MTLPQARPSPVDVAHSALILTAFALLATENLVHYPVAVMALVGLGQMVRVPRAVLDDAARPLLLLFGLVWVPMLLSLSDAVDPGRSTETVLLYLHFLPAAYYLMRVCTRPAVFKLVTQGVVVLVLFAGLDAFAQLIWRENLFGYPYDGHILKGVFHPKQRLGLFLAVFAPLCIEVVRYWSGRFPRLWLLYVPMGIVILMSLKRSAWLMLAAGLGALAVLRRRSGRRRSTRRLALQLVLVGAVVFGAVFASPALRSQFATVAGLVSGDAAAFDRASSYRLSLWRTGAAMFGDNWLNGVGPRGYRTAYIDYAAADDFWVARNGSGQTHPHLIVLEVATETGLIGLLAGGALFAWLIVEIRRLRHTTSAVWLLCAVVAWLPINVHLAFYGSYWSTLAWLLLGIGLGGRALESISARIRHDAAPAAP